MFLYILHYRDKSSRFVTETKRPSYYIDQSALKNVNLQMRKPPIRPELRRSTPSACLGSPGHQQTNNACTEELPELSIGRSQRTREIKPKGNTILIIRLWLRLCSNFSTVILVYIYTHINSKLHHIGLAYT